MRITVPLSLFALALTPLASADHGPHVSVDKNGVILNGYDAVAYFTLHKAVKGKAEFTVKHDGAIYRFANAKHRAMFLENPGKYAPQFGGWCAYGAALGKKFPVDGKAFEVVDGKLYVNLDKKIQRKWSKKRDQYIDDAHREWPVIKETPAKKL